MMNNNTYPNDKQILLDFDKMTQLIQDAHGEILSDMPKFGRSIGKRIEDALYKFNEATGLSIDKTGLARILRLSKSKISSMINGSRPPRIDQLYCLAKLLHVSTDYLLGLEEYTTDLEGYRTEQKITGLSQLSITNLIKYSNSKRGTFTTDTLFRNYNINYNILIRNETENSSTERVALFFPNLIFNFDYSKYISDKSIDVLNLPESITDTLLNKGILTIATLLTIKIGSLKEDIGFNDENINAIEISVRNYLEDKFEEKYYRMKEMRATEQKLLKAYTAMYSGDLLFLNSIVEDGIAFLSIEENVSALCNLKIQMESCKSKLKVINESIEKIEKDLQGEDNEQSKTRLATLLNWTRQKRECREKQEHYRTQIEYAKMEIYSSISRAIRKYINKNIQMKASEEIERI